MTESKSSHRQILKSTSLIGSSTVISVAIRVFSTKILAVLIGPSGVALFSLYGSVTQLITTLTGMGIQTSGVRQVAEANGQGDRHKISRTVITLRRCTLLLGALGAAVLLIFSAPISRLTFGDGSHAGALALLSLCILFTAVSSGQTALIQGMRRIRDLATIRIAGAFGGLLVTIPLIVLLRERGVAPSMVAAAAALLLVSWWFARRVPVDRIALSWKETYSESKGLIGLGFAFMLSGFMAAATAYFIRTSITRQLGLEAAGHYQAAFNLSGVYVGIILGAMGADFYPRLTAAARDNETCNRLVNEQSEVGLLIAGPGIVATLALAPLVVRLFYSAEFLPAVDVLRWQILGLLGRIVVWPMGFVVQAKGRGKVFVGTETASNIVHVLLIVYAMQRWGLVGTGMAFFALYVYQCAVIRSVVGRMSGFRWTSAYLRLLMLYSAAIFSAFAAPTVLAPTPALALSCGIAVFLAMYSCYRFYWLLGPEFLRRKLEASPLKYVARLLRKR